MSLKSVQSCVGKANVDTDSRQRGFYKRKILKPLSRNLAGILSEGHDEGYSSSPLKCFKEEAGGLLRGGFMAETKHLLRFVVIKLENYVLGSYSFYFLGQ